MSNVSTQERKYNVREEVREKQEKWDREEKKGMR